MKKLYISAFFLVASFSTFAQTPAGNCFRSDYDDFQTDNLRRFFNCGNDNMLNTGDEITIEVWLQFRDLGDNQKVIGKFGLNNSGYLLGVGQGRIYGEVWNPIHYEPQDGLMNPTAMHWQHLAMTFTKGDSIRTYINGKKVGSTVVSNNPISTNTDPLIIGIASWDMSSFQSFGNIDEVRLWDVARTGDQIRETMFTELSGSETGLVAYYDFNQSTGNTLPDVSGNGNTGTGTNVDASEWVSSKAVIANANTKTKSDLRGLWNGLSFMDPRVASSSNGMTMVASNMDTADYVVFGHDGGNGTSSSDLETTIPANFERTARIWSTTEVGKVKANVLMKLSDAAGTGTSLDGSKPAANYTLLFRSGTTGAFTLAGRGASISNGVITFSNVRIQEGEYTLGVGDAEYAGVIGITSFEDGTYLSLFPNPSNGIFTLSSKSSNSSVASISVLDIRGKVVYTGSWNGNAMQLDLSDREAGLYFLNIVSEGRNVQKRLVIQ